MSLCFGAIFVGGETLEVRDRPIVGDGLGCLGKTSHKADGDVRIMQDGLPGSVVIVTMVSKSPKDWVGDPETKWPIFMAYKWGVVRSPLPVSPSSKYNAGQKNAQRLIEFDEKNDAT